MSEDPIEILVQLAERGEIDPWKIDIVEVTDRFFSELERRKEMDLRVSGRALFYASLLLRIKSECFGISDDEDEEEFIEEISDEEEMPDWDMDCAASICDSPIDLLEREIKRRLERKHLRKRPETLFELITALRYLEKNERRRQRSRTIGERQMITAEDVVGIAHDEGYRDAAVLVLEWCNESFAEGRVLTVGDLAIEMGWNVANVYIPLLFLMLDGKVALVQLELFGAISIHPYGDGD